MVAACDWSKASPACSPLKHTLAACPLFDALVLGSLARDSPALTFVKAGGSARGFGRCNRRPCRSPPHPALDPSCQEAACSVAEGEEGAGWCETVDDGGRVLTTTGTCALHFDADCPFLADQGQAWYRAAAKTRPSNHLLTTWVRSRGGVLGEAAAACGWLRLRRARARARRELAPPATARAGSSPLPPSLPRPRPLPLSPSLACVLRQARGHQRRAAAACSTHRQHTHHAPPAAPPPRITITPPLVGCAVPAWRASGH
eukprot:1494270-Rhodomonas_salina.1